MLFGFHESLVDIPDSWALLEQLDTEETDYYSNDPEARSGQNN
jgi:hypothetical protein